jgi:predicted Zn-dependent protease
MMPRIIKFVFFLWLAAFCVLLAPGAQAQTIIRDTEIENYFNEWFSPIFQANGMQPSQVKIIIVQDNDINAFVAGGANIFLYTGLIDETDHPGELIGVMAHELAHIQGGHLVRGREAMEQASYEAILGTILGAGAAVASGQGGALATGSMAGSSMAQRRFMATTRTFESSADQAALRSMEQADINPEGLLTFMRKLEGQEALPASQQMEYVRSHPLTRDRIGALENRVKNSAANTTPLPAHWMEQHARMQAKLTGFINPGQVSWKYDDRDQSVAARYARAIAAYRQNDIDTAQRLIDTLIAEEPDNAYFHELKGQMLVDFGRVRESLPAYEKAASLDPNSGLIRTAYAHALIQTANGDNAVLEKAIDNLVKAQRSEPRSTRVQRLLATAYGQLGREADARLALAEEALLEQKKPYAAQQAKIALQGFEPGSRGAIRANDILIYVQQNRK